MNNFIPFGSVLGSHNF